jgi:hypothetical protein
MKKQPQSAESFFDMRAKPSILAAKHGRQLQRIKESAFLMGVRCGAKVSAELMKSGWTDVEKLEAEVFRRVQSGRRKPHASQA